MRHKILKPIFHCNTKYLASGVGVGQCPRRQNCLALPNATICVFPYAKPQRQSSIGCVGSQRKILALAMYISCFLCRFHLRLVPNANPISSGIWPLKDIFFFFFFYYIKSSFRTCDMRHYHFVNSTIGIGDPSSKTPRKVRLGQ